MLSLSLSLSLDEQPGVAHRHLSFSQRSVPGQSCFDRHCTQLSVGLQKGVALLQFASLRHCTHVLVGLQ